MPKPKKGKVKSVARLKKDLWVIFSRFIRCRDALLTTGNIAESTCITCWKRYPITSMDCGHFLSRSHTSVLFDEKNCHAQCVKCNYGGGEQYLYSRRIVEMYSQDELNRLIKMKNETKKFTPMELTIMITDYKQRVKDLTDKHSNPWQ